MNGGVVILLAGVLLMILGFKGTAKNVLTAAVSDGGNALTNKKTTIDPPRGGRAWNGPGNAPPGYPGSYLMQD